MASINAPLPIWDPIARPRDPNTPRGQRDPLEGTIPLSWIQYFTSQSQQINAAPQSSKKIILAQSAAIATTSIPNPSSSSGAYRVSYYTRITTPATTSSSLTVTIGFTDNGVAESFSGTAITLNTVLAAQTNTYLIFSDAAAPITYSTAYASVGATPMQYKLMVVLEQLP